MFLPQEFLTLIDGDDEEGKIVTKLFYDTAMKWFKAKYRTGNIIFVVVSDDMSWCKKMFNDHRDVILASSAPNNVR